MRQALDIGLPKEGFVFSPSGTFKIKDDTIALAGFEGKGNAYRKKASASFRMMTICD